jgi:hypothetical protein
MTPRTDIFSPTTMASSERLIEVFNEAQNVAPGPSREEYLAQACGGDAALIAQVHSLLGAQGRAGGAFMQAGPALSPEVEAELARLKPEAVGERIGPYRLMEQIGEGGFGTVWVADQGKAGATARGVEDHQGGDGHEGCDCPL